MEAAPEFASGLSFPKQLTPVVIRRAAMDLLTRREHSSHELLTKLSRKFSKLAEVDELDPDVFTDLIVAQISILTSEKLQSDERFVESFINGRKSQGKGPLRIRQELEQRKVSSDLVAEYLDDSDEYWMELARGVYRKKFAGKAVASYEEKAKRLRFMLYRGFPHSLLRALIQ